MSAFLDIFMTIYNFMKDTTILSFSIGDQSVSLTFLNVLVGTSVISIGISALHKIFEW